MLTDAMDTEPTTPAEPKKMGSRRQLGLSDPRAATHFYNFVLMNKMRMPENIAKLGAENNVKFSAEVAEQELAHRFQLDGTGLEPPMKKGSRGTRVWEAQARVLIDVAVGRWGAGKFDRICALMPYGNLEEYSAILHGLAQMVCLDSSSELMPAKFTARSVNTLLITSALLSDEYINHSHNPEKGFGSKVQMEHERRVKLIVEMAFSRLDDSATKWWLENFTNKNLAQLEKEDMFKSPIVWYAIAALYLGYGYCIYQASARMAQALTMRKYPSSSKTLFPLTRPARGKLDWLEIAIAQVTWRGKAPNGHSAHEWAMKMNLNLIYQWEEAMWEENDEEGHAEKFQTGDDDEASGGDAVYALAADEALEERQRKRTMREATQDYYGGMSLREMLDMD